jgi:hypothetical protein
MNFQGNYSPLLGNVVVKRKANQPDDVSKLLEDKHRNSLSEGRRILNE